MIQENVIHKFYTAFQNREAETMVSCYHPEVEFEDPAFGKLHGKEAGNMWRMLLENGDKNLAITYSQVIANETTGSANWEAKYKFSKTGRMVHNKIKASFEFKDDLIIKHTDDFNFWKWSRMALGIPGMLLGFSSFFQNKVRVQVKKALKAYENKRNL